MEQTHSTICNSKFTVDLSKIENPGANVDLAIFQSSGGSYGEFSEPDFPHNFAPKNGRRNLKMGCTDASRRQLQSMLKIGV
jgi:hypothetical protein